MDSSEKPSWVKRMENGTIGEATAREFLIDRFWILERSVDVHGADLIIQRRLTTQNILDKNPPKFGVIQVKFFQDEFTTQYIPNEYILDEEGNERKEFFVLAISGYEDSKKIYLLTSQDIKENFEKISDEKKTHFNSFRLSGKQIFSSKKFLVNHKKTALDKIENTLNLSSFNRNRLFISYIVPEINKEIDSPYIINIANDQGDFKKMQNELKDVVRSTIFNMEDTIENLNRLLGETDPLKIEEIFEDLEYLDNRGNLSFSLDIDINFFDEARNYKQKHDNLEKHGMLHNFVKDQDIIKHHIKNDNIINEEITDDDIYLINISFNSDLSYFNIVTKVDSVVNIFPASEQKLYSGFINESPNSFTYYYVPNNHGYWDNTKKGLETFKVKRWSEALVRMSEGMIPIEIMNYIYEKLIGY